MFEKLTTPAEVFSFKLGSALSMERDILGMLPDLQEDAQRDEVTQLLRTHHDETRRHVQNIENAFELLGEGVDDSPSPVTKGLAKEGKSTIRKTDDALVDAVLLSGAAETEHHEIAVYEGLITFAQAMGKGEVVQLLEHNLEQEKHTLEEVRNATHHIAAQKVGGPA